MPHRDETRKYIIGWLTFPPGRRAAFMDIALPYIHACRSEPGCLFFEMNPSVTDPDVVTLAECFASEAVHAEHLARAEFQQMWPKLAALAISARFENVIAARVTPDEAKFSGPT